MVGGVKEFIGLTCKHAQLFYQLRSVLGNTPKDVYKAIYSTSTLSARPDYIANRGAFVLELVTRRLTRDGMKATPLFIRQQESRSPARLEKPIECRLKEAMMASESQTES